VCARCKAFDAGTEVDLIEIDAASNTGVDHVRALRDQAAYVPIAARFKVFLIDEVHMLSKAAFNALLKTLEEPPPHVKFLFATTELHKVPDTVVSRCQVLRLSPLAEDRIRARLDEVFALEGVEVEEGVTTEIARRARGGMRDALSLADQLLALVGRAPTVADTARLAGMDSTESIEAVLDAVLAEDKPALLAALPGREGDEPAFLDGLLGYLRTALLLKLVGDDAPMVGETLGPDARARMSERAGGFGADRLELVLQELLHARERMGPIHMRAHARLILETTLLDLCTAAATMPLGALVQRLEALEGRAGGAPSGVEPARAAQAAGGAAPAHRAAREARGAPAPGANEPAPDAPPAGTAAAPPAPGAATVPSAATGAEPAATAPAATAPAATAPAATAPAATAPAATAPAATVAAAPAKAAPPRGEPAPARARSGAASRPSAPPAGGPSPRDASPDHHTTEDPPDHVLSPAAPPRVQTNSTADRWEGFLAELRGRSQPLADLFARKGTLVRAVGGVAPLKLRGLREDELALVRDPAAERAAADAFRAAIGDGVRLQLEVHDASTGGADGFTEELRELFRGRIER
ncbi:MAG: hypothetical protein AAFP22_04655, partial [Planctomycetota bacterium]